MSTVYSNIGVLEKQNERQFVRTHKLDEGYVLYGTYQHLGTGRYSVKFDIRPDDDADAGVVCCKIDVVTNQGRVKLLERMLSVRELRENDSELDVEFKMLEPGPAEYRVFATGTTGLRVACDLRASVIPDSTGPTIYAPTQERFVSPREKWLVVSNCATFGLANSLTLLNPSIEIDAVDIWKFKNDLEKYRQPGALSSYARVLIHPAIVEVEGAEFMRAAKPHCVPSVSFAAYHPDITSAKAQEQFFKGPMGTYHSLIVLAAHELGYDAAKTVSFFMAKPTNALATTIFGARNGMQQSQPMPSLAWTSPALSGNGGKMTPSCTP